MHTLIRTFFLTLLFGAALAAENANAFASDAKRTTEFPVIFATDLPQEARDTLALIKKRGPFPYTKDGVVFSNRERILPKQARGYYREYTVKTPRAKNRGARRIISGAPGEYYYTHDHYISFKRIKE